MKKQDIITLGHKLVTACNRTTPQLPEIEKLTGTQYTKIRQESIRHLTPILPPNPSNHLKATTLAVIFFDNQIFQLYGPDKSTDPQDRSNDFHDTKIIALQNVLHNLHIFQVAHEKEILKEQTAIAAE